LGSSQTYVHWYWEYRSDFGLEQGAQTMDEYYNQVMAICKERNMYQLLSNDLKTMEKQHQDVDVVWFLLNLKPEYETVRL
jgi:hypothetical protein